MDAWTCACHISPVCTACTYHSRGSQRGGASQRHDPRRAASRGFGSCACDACDCDGRLGHAACCNAGTVLQCRYGVRTCIATRGVSQPSVAIARITWPRQLPSAVLEQLRALRPCARPELRLEWRYEAVPTLTDCFAHQAAAVGKFSGRQRGCGIGLVECYDNSQGLKRRPRPHGKFVYANPVLWRCTRVSTPLPSLPPCPPYFLREGDGRCTTLSSCLCVDFIDSRVRLLTRGEGMGCLILCLVFTCTCASVVSVSFSYPRSALSAWT